MMKWSLCFLVQICLLQLALGQIKVRYAYSETYSMDEGLEHSVVGDIITDHNDLLWIAVNGNLQLFDGDQFVDMGHLIHTSNTTGHFGFENGKVRYKTNVGQDLKLKYTETYEDAMQKIKEASSS